MKLLPCQQYFQGFFSNLKNIKLSEKSMTVVTQGIIRSRTFGEITKEFSYHSGYLVKIQSTWWKDPVKFLSGEAKISLALHFTRFTKKLKPF